MPRTIAERYFLYLVDAAKFVAQYLVGVIRWFLTQGARAEPASSIGQCEALVVVVVRGVGCEPAVKGTLDTCREILRVYLWNVQ